MKYVILVLICTITLVTLLVSCNQPETTTTLPTGTTTTPSSSNIPTTSSADSSDQPQYGGTITTFTTSDPMGFDEAYTPTMMCNTLRLTNQELMMGDWAKGPAGSNEIDWFTGYLGRIEVETGCIAESWELVDDSTIVFNIRHGVHFALNQNSEASKLVGGREVTADDVVYCINRQWTTPSSFIYMSNVPQNRLISVKALDKYTVECKVPTNVQGQVLFTTGDQCKIIPPEVVEKYGDMKNWKNSVGTGPYMLVDFVPSASLTYEKNPNYWQKDPLRPENQLPYASGYKELVLTDTSTQQAAFRTGKLEIISNFAGGLSWDDFQSIITKYPEAKYIETSGAHPALWGRMDKPELPFKDLRVRQALNMAIDKQAIVDHYYDGHADLCSPIYPNNTAYEPFTTPFDEMPQDVKDLFTYDPERAKQLLADAGYPDGFTTKVACTQNDADFVALIVADWAKVNVTLEIQQMETGVFNSVMRGRTHEEMIYKESTSRGFPYKMNEVLTENLDNVAFFESEQTRAAYNEIQLYVGKDDARWAKILHDVYPFIIAQSPGIWLPSPSAYKLWQPWLKGFHGESNVGYDNPYGYLQYIWIDSSVKQSMGN